MKSIFKFGFLISITLLLISTGFDVVAQTSTSSNETVLSKKTEKDNDVSVEILKDRSSISLKQNSTQKFYYYRIHGDVKEIEKIDKTISLVLKKNDGPKKLLCTFTKAMGRTYKFPECLARDLGVNDFLTESGYYKYYFTSNGIDGSPVSKIISLEKPISNYFDANNQGIVMDLEIQAKKYNNKNYYHISGYINKTKPGKTIYFKVVREGETSGEIIGEWKYEKGDFAIPSNDEERNRIGNLVPGKYVLKIFETDGPQLQPDISIPQKIRGDNAPQTFEESNWWNPALEGGLVQTNCGYKLEKGGRICNFSDLMILVSRVIDYIFVLILPIAAIIFAYAGYLFITSGGNPEKRTAAKKAMTSLVIGIVIIMMAWLLVKTVLATLGVKEGFRMFLNF